LDETGDGRLSLREMKNAAGRLAAFDKNNDGKIASGEMPVELTVAFSRGGYYGYRGRAVFAGGRRIPARNATPSKKQGPEWFVRMDKNGDGDLTPREFLGDADKFKQLDTNGDGFIERKEAEAAGKP
jgi:Ca2+-binding EF-hand superfamily protein